MKLQKRRVSLLKKFPIFSLLLQESSCFAAEKNCKNHSRYFISHCNPYLLLIAQSVKTLCSFYLFMNNCDQQRSHQSQLIDRNRKVDSKCDTFGPVSNNCGGEMRSKFLSILSQENDHVVNNTEIENNLKVYTINARNFLTNIYFIFGGEVNISTLVWNLLHSLYSLCMFA